jgi:lipopolysaccharide transport system ATP-binding protein
VAAMLELGMGFHPDFTGRQNVYMSGQLLGMTSDEISQLMPEIEAFAEIGEFIDMPARVYSSGMQMRLAFSVATAIRPDILIVDEALSVGDTYFQHKSFERIRKFRELGTTLLIVSHDKQAIQSICDTAILLSQSRVLLHADPESVFDLYNASIVGDKNQKITQHKDLSGKLKTTSGSGKASVINLRLLNEAEEDLKVVSVGQNVILRAQVLVRDELPRLVFGFAIKDRLGQVLYGTNTFLQSKVLQNLKAGQYIEYDFSFPMNLGVGSYSFQTALHSDINHLSENFEWIDLAHTFEVINLDMPHFEGVLWIDPAIRIRMNDGIL